MTTAHKPTWHNALGGETQGGTRLAVATTKRCARDQPGELTVKTRQKSQLPETTDRKTLAEELKRQERIHKAKQRKALQAAEKEPTLLFSEVGDNPFPEDADDVESAPAPFNADAAVESDDDSSDDEEELLRELEKIKKERAEKEAAAAKAEEDRRKAEQKERMLRANPLLLSNAETAGSDCAPLKRRWDDEVVFKNQAKNLPKTKKQFINDPVRSEFHKKFLSKYID